VIVFGATYVVTIGVTAAMAEDKNVDTGALIGTSFVPVIGPWIIAGKAIDGVDTQPPYQALLALSGLAQLAGIALTVAGIVVKREVVRPVYAIDLKGSTKLTLQPAFLAGTGLGLTLAVTRF
jgi:hypothetical protein